VLEQCRHRIGRHLHDATRRVIELAKKAGHERRDVLEPLTERRNVDVEHVQPIVEVGAKLTVCHRAVQVPVRRRNHAHVGSHRTRAAQPHELTLLQHAQELRLSGGRHLGDFVQKQHTS
jgi:hypothetical protein